MTPKNTHMHQQYVISNTCSQPCSTHRTHWWHWDSCHDYRLSKCTKVCVCCEDTEASFARVLVCRHPCVLHMSRVMHEKFTFLHISHNSNWSLSKCAGEQWETSITQTCPTHPAPLIQEEQTGEQGMKVGPLFSCSHSEVDLNVGGTGQRSKQRRRQRPRGSDSRSTGDFTVLPDGVFGRRCHHDEASPTVFCFKCRFEASRQKRWRPRGPGGSVDGPQLSQTQPFVSLPSRCFW